ncbi:MAG TPA: BamA/TamA family outer membrane protein [Vicinamibacterales bacterium]|nr:BamA/TamA family outer membrane protein [Vicinamibacterales bacterium]
MRRPLMRRLSSFGFALSLVCSAACREGDGIVVTDLRFEGVKSVSEAQLRAALATAESSWLPWGPKRYFDRAQFEADLRRIEAFYADRGYPDAKVVAFDVDLNDRQDGAAITIRIEEGRPVIVRSVRFEGFDVIPPEHLERLREDVPLREGAPRDRAAVQVTRERALDELRDHGYPYAQVEVREEPAGERAVAIAYRAEPGTIAYFGPIEIVGNTSVDDDVVRRQLTYRPGQLFRYGQIQESQRRLYGLELFEFANIETVQTGERSAEVPTRVTVTEGKHRKVEFSVGWGSEEKLRAEGRWRHVNFFGGARTLGLQARWSSLDRGVRLNFNQPYLFHPAYSLDLAAENWHSDQPAYRLDSRGGRLTVTRQISAGEPLRPRRAVTTASLGLVHQWEDYSISREALEDLSFRDELIALRLDPRTGTGGGLLVALDLDLQRNTTGNLLDARQGYFAGFHLEQAGGWLPGDFDYYELSLEGRHYLTVAERFVWANRLRVATLDGPDPIAEHVPFFKRYFLGGSSSLRGWGRFEVSPLSGAGLPLGGHSMLEASSELRMPVWGDFSLVLFVDAGNAWTAPWGFDFGDLRYDVGPGVRYLTPVGPFRFDVGYQLNPIPGLLVDGRPQPRRFRIHLSIGQAF